MKKTRYFVIFLTLIAVCLCLCGCAPVYEVYVRAMNCDVTNYRTDIFVKITEDDPSYTDVDVNAVRSAFIRTNPDVEFDNDEICEAFKTTELYRYSVDGYRSVTIHHNHYQTYENECFDFFAENEFDSFCKKYKTCKIAIINDFGDIIHISDEVPMVLHNRYTLDPNIMFNTTTGEVKVSYANHSDEVFCRNLAWVMLLPPALISMLVICVVLILKRKEQAGREKRFMVSGIIMAIFALPLAYIGIMDVVDIFLSKTTFSQGWSSITMNDISIQLINLMPIVFTIVLLTKAMFDKMKKA